MVHINVVDGKVISHKHNFLKSFVKELFLWIQIVKYDLAASTIPAVIFAIAVWHTYSRSLYELIFVLSKSLVYFFLYIFTFCLSNQLTGIEEDKLNKPDRPLVRGLVSRKGALVRWGIGMLLYTLIGYWFGVLGWTLLWQIASILHNFGGWSKHWFTKNVIMFFGTLAQLAAAWELIMPLNATGWRWVLTIALGVFFLVSLQDLRDVDGDKVNHRKTLPIVYGMKPVRIALAIGFAVQAIVVHVMLVLPAGQHLAYWMCSIILGISCFFIAYRILRYHTPKADHRTYMFYNYWYCLVLGCAFVLL
jgi:4-hydroxybenzoate polyprenyltransferase